MREGVVVVGMNGLPVPACLPSDRVILCGVRSGSGVRNLVLVLSL